MELAPIVLFVYNRPEHTLRTLESLMKNKLAAQSRLYIFADGAKADASAETLQQIKRTREIINSKKWCGDTFVLEGQSNKGLAASIMEGVTRILNEFGKAIVLEDDLVTAPGFLDYMNRALDKYENEKEVACISGYVYPLKTKFEHAYFIKGADCWGWATWKDRWENLNMNASKIRNEIVNKGLLSDFTFNGSYPYMQMLKEREEGKNQSWAILWYASSLLQNKLCLYPAHSLVHNIGNDGSGTHTIAAINKFDIDLREEQQIIFPSVTKEEPLARKAFELFFLSLHKEPPSDPSFSGRILKRIKNLFSK